jgi:N4-gp56 family major capsid protein
MNEFTGGKKKGDTVTFPLLMDMAGTGVTDDTAIEGAEEALVYYNFAVTLHLRANGAKAAGPMSEQRTLLNLRGDMRDALSRWMSQITDSDILYALSGIANPAGTVALNGPSTARRWYGGQTTAGVVEAVAADVNIDSATTNLFGTAVISLMKRKAQLATPKISPINVEGEDKYIMLIHPYQAKALKGETAWLNAQHYANVRGRQNPLFSGALGEWDGVIIHEYDKIFTRTGDGGGENLLTNAFETGDVCANTHTVARALFLGAQACVIAYAKEPGWYEKMFDYNRVPGVATDVLMAIGKTEFNSQDFGVITVDTEGVVD